MYTSGLSNFSFEAKMQNHFNVKNSMWVRFWGIKKYKVLNMYLSMYLINTLQNIYIEFFASMHFGFAAKNWTGLIYIY